MREYDHACELEPVSQIVLDVDNLQANVVLYDLETAGLYCNFMLNHNGIKSKTIADCSRTRQQYHW